MGEKRIMRRAALWLAALLPFALSAAQPAFPGAVGFGTDTPGGRGGRILKVTSLAADGPGSLRAALEAKGPRVVVFEVGGVIDLNGTILRVDEPFLTVAGQTAPSPGITLIGGGIAISAHDVVLRHLCIRCSLTWAVDENLSAGGARHEGRERTAHRVLTVPSLRGVTPLAPPLVFERRQGAKGEPDKLVLRLDAGSGKDVPPAPSAEAPLALAPGWHAFELRWTGGTMTAAVDGKETMQLAVPSLNLPEATGAGLLTQARFVFGGPRAALDAIDDLSTWRK